MKRNVFDKLERANRLGWRAKLITRQTVVECEGGCGRVVINDPDDKQRRYLCPVCRASITGYLNVQKRWGVEAAEK